MEALLKLPENWHVVVTDENRELVRKWADGIINHSGSYEKGYCYGMKGSEIDSSFPQDSHLMGQEISTADFKRLVLGETMEKKYEYRLRDQKNRVAVDKITQNENLPYEKYYGQSLNPECLAVRTLKDYNVLDLFFEKVEVVELPVINGDRAYFFEGSLNIEGYPFEDNFFDNPFKSITLENGTEVTEENVNQIRKYLQCKK